MDRNLNDIFSDSNNANNYSVSDDVKRKKLLIKIVAIVLVVALLTGCALTVGIVIGRNTGFYGDMPLMLEAYELMKKYYYEDISWETFQEVATSAFAGSLDTFSGIASSDADAATSGTFGFTFTSSLYNEHYISYLIPNFPAASACAIARFNADGTIDETFDPTTEEVYMSEGDELFEIGVKVPTHDGKIRYESYVVEHTSASYLRQVVTTYSDFDEMTFVIKKYKGDGEYYEGYYVYELKRSTWEDNEKLAYFYDLTDEVGIIRLREFSKEADVDFAFCIQQFVAARKSKLILDLRDNGGGELTSLEYVAQYLLKNPNASQLPIMNLISNSGNGKMVSDIAYSSEINTASAEVLPKAYPLGNAIEDFEIVVLTNGGTASASEALIGALQYYNGTKIVGLRTYGKGVAQRVFPLSTGDLLYVTNGKYFIPTAGASGEIKWEVSIHGTGFVPEDENKVGERITEYSTDKCTARAMEILGY